MITTGQLFGLERLEDALSRIGDDEEISRIVTDTAEQIAAAARSNLKDGAPPDSKTGALEASIVVAGGAHLGQKLIGTDLDHGAYLEFGTLRMPAYPWLAAAFDQVAAMLPERLRQALKR